MTESDHSKFPCHGNLVVARRKIRGLVIKDQEGEPIKLTYVMPGSIGFIIQAWYDHKSYINNVVLINNNCIYVVNNINDINAYWIIVEN